MQICIHTYKHIRFTPCDSRRLFLRPAVCIWTPLSDLPRTERPISFHFQGCDFASIFLGPAGCIRTHSAAILMTRGLYFETHELLVGIFWSSGPGLRSQWDTLAHFLEKVRKMSQMEIQLELQMERFSIHFRYLFYFVGVVAGAWRRLVSGCSFCNVLWEFGKRNMDLTSFFMVPNAHHIFGSRV